MHLKRVILENIRGFKTLDFNFERSEGQYGGWTVITGDNASGKTAFLKAVSLAMTGPEAARILQPSLSGWIHSRSDNATIALQIVPGEKDSFAQGKRYEKPFWAELELKSADAFHVELRPGKKYLRKGKGATRGPWLESPDGWFCVGYGPFRRLYGHSPEAQRLMSMPGKVSRFATLFREDATLVEGDLWLRDLRYRQLEGNEESGIILEKITAVLDAGFLQHEIRVEKVDSEGLWLRQRDGIILSLENMSDGYRSAIAMLVDVIRQMISVYGSYLFELSADNEIAGINCSGVVLIDEIDAHLHPSWQRKIGEWFKRVMPNVQFIVTSHSPMICQAADEKGIFKLPGPGSEVAPFQLPDRDYREVIRSRPDEILIGPAFELEHSRSQRAVKAREEYAKLQSKKKSMSA